jgi:hypothetical protein
MDRSRINPEGDQMRVTPASSSISDHNGGSFPVTVNEVPIPRLSVPHRAAVPMPSPGTVSAPKFDGTNATRFFDRFEVLAADHGLQQEAFVDRMLLYCTAEVDRVISTFPEAFDRDWKEFRRVVQEEYKSQDEKELASTREYLNRLCVEVPRTLPQLKNYIRQYLSIANALEARHELDAATKCTLFVQGLPVKARRQVLSRTGWNKHKPSTWDCGNLVKEALKYVATEENIEAFDKPEEFSQKI